MKIKDAYERITKYRSVIMGVAILWVVWFHSDLFCTQPVLSTIRKFGYGGVDIFFFLSGMGVYQSLSRNSNIIDYYKRRITRIMPIYLFFITGWTFVTNVDKLLAFSVENLWEILQCYLGNIFMTGWFFDIEGQFNWYVQALMWFYFIAPAIYGYLKQNMSEKKKVAGLFVALLCIQLTALEHFTLMAVCRLILFIMGMLVTRYGLEEKEIRISPFLLWGFFVIGVGLLLYCNQELPEYMVTYGLWWYPFILITPGFIIGLTRLLSLLEKTTLGRIACRLFCEMGKCSFEIYLIHIPFFVYLPKLFPVKGDIEWLITVITAIGMGVLFKKVWDYIKTVKVRGKTL